MLRVNLFKKTKHLYANKFASVACATTVQFPGFTIGNAFNSATVDKRTAIGSTLSLNAQAGQIEREVTRTVQIELENGRAAPTSVVVTVQPNVEVNSQGAGSSQ